MKKEYLKIQDLDKQNENKGKQIAELQRQFDKQVEKTEREKELDSFFWKQVCDRLQKALSEKDKEITMLKSQNQFFMEEAKRLDQISNLKDQEIEELKKDLKSQKGLTDLYSTIAGTNATKMSIEKATRKQICEKIREFCKEHRVEDDFGELTINVDDELNSEDNLLIALDKIERGE